MNSTQNKWARDGANMNVWRAGWAAWLEAHWPDPDYPKAKVEIVVLHFDIV
jgi:hypothetical protein